MSRNPHKNAVELSAMSIPRVRHRVQKDSFTFCIVRGIDNADNPDTTRNPIMSATNAADSHAERMAYAATLDEMAKSTGDARYARAAGALRGKPGGRPPCDDSAALRQMRDLIACGTASGIEQAARFVSRTVPGQHSTAATAARLAMKYRRLHSSI
jgi:hypothetical protein